ncbi:MAG TPA: N-acetyl-gamma-glutamyl-phosphate reductase [Caulobacteraceae bacterium]|jgi:N-acetyl-gamma-glutamyl-phosphate reductase|nr:N-acetyl-gamma-glutamyl-phosphate reductase [Caulobacteraceae bacterium]
MGSKIFIDGEAGTTGLQIRDRLAGRRDLDLVSIDPALRKDAGARAEALNGADIVILCLPDEAARESVGLITSDRVRVIDASSAHRTDPAWVYGFPELAHGQRDAIARTSRVSNPGCWPTGFLSLVRPLVDSGLVPRDWPLCLHGVSGYTGGGKSMIADFEDPKSPAFTSTAYRLYALGLGHKHLPEMQVHAGLSYPPLFSPAVGRFAQGMIVEVPLPLAQLPGAPTPSDIRSALEERYPQGGLVRVASADESATLKTLEAESLAGQDGMVLHVFGNAGQVRLAAVLDNLGKGAAGAAVQNLNLMLGLDERTGLN